MNNRLFSFNKLVSSLAVLALTGCSSLSEMNHSFQDYVYSSHKTPIERKQLELVNVEYTVALEGAELSASQLQQLSDFIKQQGSSYKQRVLVKANLDSLTKVLKPLDKLLQQEGIVAEYRQYLADETVATGQLVVISEYFQLVFVPCLVSNRTDLGCASQKNLAISLPDPGQLIRARAAMPADGVKAAQAVTRYRTAEQSDNNNSDFFAR